MSFPVYPAYKDSGVDWLGDLPSSWSVKRIKHTTYLKGRIGWKGLTSDEYLKDGYAYLVTGTDFSGKFIKWQECPFVDLERYEDDPYIQLTDGDLLITKDGTIGKLALVSNLDRPACLNSGIFLIRPTSDYSTEFMYWMLQSNAFRVFCDLSSVGSTIQHLYQNVFEDFAFPVPTFEEQRTIARFLDHQTAKLDELVAAQQQLIQLLKEKRHAVLTQAVTKGLDPSVPMKDSGVEWLGDVPAHWHVGKVKHFFATTSGSTPHTDRQDIYYNGEIPWIRSLDLTDGEITDWEIGITPAAIEDTACKVLPIGTVLVAMYGGGGTIGKNGLLRISAATNQAICAILPSPQFDPAFVHAFMQHQRPYWMVGAEGTRKDPNISQDRVRNAVILCPPLAEQRAIREHLEKAALCFGSLEKEADTAISLLVERRTALISAAVTGKIDVRAMAAAQPA